jgi:hypothetical protein
VAARACIVDGDEFQATAVAAAAARMAIARGPGAYERYNNSLATTRIGSSSHFTCCARFPPVPAAESTKITLSVNFSTK